MGRSRATPACLQRFDLLGAESAGHSLTEAIVVPPAPKRLERSGVSAGANVVAPSAGRPAVMRTRSPKGHGGAAFQELGK